ncbi:MAG: BrxA/BrxB family bacilliredoxin [Ignavibacteriaceae bacterium]|jgi:putative YphP/YqiW family bacilliredoxin|nr:BrxA/BrxB family bacilliredoxin [Ignavibacteriaceae bacterium]
MLNTLRSPLYDEASVQHMRDELVAVGFEEARTPEAVDDAILNNPGKTVFVVINSVCGCAAGSARPGVSLALQHDTIPDKYYTVFAGQERDAVDRLRTYIKGFPPSSPSAALFKDGELVYFLPRLDIEGRTAAEISQDIMVAFEKHCSATGPSIPADQFEKVLYAKMCGSKIPLYKG